MSEAPDGLRAAAPHASSRATAPDASGGDEDFRARQLALFDVSVLKQAKWRELADAVGPTEGLEALDLGSDNGVISWLFRQRGGRWTSADLTDETVCAIRRMVGERVDRLGGPTLPYAEASFDRVVVVDLLEHVHDDRALLGELTRVLRPGGRLVLNVPHEAPRRLLPRLLPRVRRALGLTDAWHGHVHAGYDVDRLRSLAPPVLRLVRARQYSRAWSHALDTALNWQFLRASRGRVTATAKGMVVTGDAVGGGGRALLRRAYPLMRAWASLDALLPLGRGYLLLVTFEKSPSTRS